MSDSYIVEPMIDEITDELLERRSEVSAAAVAEELIVRFIRLPNDQRLRAIGEALAGVTGARMERRTVWSTDLVNVSTDAQARVARATPETLKLAAERRRARTPGGKDS